MTLEEKIAKFIIDLESSELKLFPYLYNSSDSDNVYYSGPTWDMQEIITIFKTLLTGKWISSGENVRKFEILFSRKFKNKYSLMVNSGSSANLVMISSLKKYFNWQDDDEIILSVVGFPTTLSPVIQNQLKPVFIDIEYDTLNFDVNQIENKITSRTKAIFVSPVLGNPPDMKKIIEICDRYEILLILDNCDSLGSRWIDKYLNEYAFCSSCSFYPAHHLTTGEGGMISSNDEEFMKIARSISWWGRDCYCIGSANLLCNGSCNSRFSNWIPELDIILDHKYLFTNVGYNLKPLDLQGSIGIIQLDKFDSFHSKRIFFKNKIAEIFKNNIKNIRIPVETPMSEVGWFGVPIICDNKIQKISLVQHLEKNGIQTRNYFAGNILLHPAFKNLDDFNKFPKANLVLDNVFFVGCSPSYTEKTLKKIESVLKNFDNI